MNAENPKSDYSEWEGEVIRELESTLDMTTSDAQGLVMGQHFYMSQSWTKGLSAKETAKVIDAKSRVEGSGGDDSPLEPRLTIHNSTEDRTWTVHPQNYTTMKDQGAIYRSIGIDSHNNSYFIDGEDVHRDTWLKEFWNQAESKPKRNPGQESWHSITGISSSVRNYFKGTHEHWEKQNRWEPIGAKWKFYGYDSEIEMVKAVQRGGEEKNRCQDCGAVPAKPGPHHDPSCAWYETKAWKPKRFNPGRPTREYWRKVFPAVKAELKKRGWKGRGAATLDEAAAAVTADMWYHKIQKGTKEYYEIMRQRREGK